MQEPTRVKVFVQIGDGDVMRFGHGLVATTENIMSGTAALLRETADKLDLGVQKDNDILRKYGKV